LISLVLPFITPKNIAKDHKLHCKLTKEKMTKRIKQGGDENQMDFFSHMISKGTYTQDMLESQANTFIVAGSETTATTLSGTAYFLLKDPECLSKLQHEIRSTFNSMEEITGDSTSSLQYLHAVVEESLRMFSAVAFGLPRISPGATVDGHYVPRGTIVSTDPWSTSHDPRYWQDSTSFRPERWVGEGFGDRKEASQPFSSGPRVCIGINLAYLEMRIILAKMAWAYDWELVDKDIDWYRDSRMYLLWKKPDMRVRFHRRMES